MVVTVCEARHRCSCHAKGFSIRRLHLEGWKLVMTGHSLGAGVAALISLKLRPAFPGGTLHAAHPRWQSDC